MSLKEVRVYGPGFALICSDSAVFSFLVQEILLDYSVLVGFVCLSAVRPLYSLSFVCTSYSLLSLASLYNYALLSSSHFSQCETNSSRIWF